MPLLLILLFGIIDFGFMINRDTMVSNAAREGVREGALNPVRVDIEAKVRQELATVEADPSKITVDVDSDATSGGTVIVKVDYQYSAITPVGSTLFDGGITLSKTSEMRIE